MAIDAGALLIGLREGLEALLVLGILFGMLSRLGHAEKGKLLWIGAGLGIVASILVGLLINTFVANWFASEGGAALFEIVVALTAVGILTYMVIWMHKHTTELLASAKRAVHAAVQDGRWVVLATLAFVTVFREGLETVLFFAARSGDVPWTDLVQSGAIGFAVSAAIAFAIFRLTVQVDLRKFFAITGTLLVFIAAGLLIHVVHAAADLGWIGHGTPLWDTSGVLPDEDHWLGGPLHALIGYEDQPTAFALLLYLTYLLGVGGFYLSSLVSPKIRVPARIAAGAVLLLLVASFAFAGTIPARGTGTDAHGHGEDAHAAGVPHDELFANVTQALQAYDGKVGVLVRAHGEPVHYNATTYQSFKEFIDGIWPYTGLPPELLKVDQGTILIDDAHPFDDMPQVDARLVDAWLDPYTLPAVPVKDPVKGTTMDEELSNGHIYLAPGAGPGMGEGDLYEILGLGTYRTWLKMENQSPMYGNVQTAWDYLEYHAKKHWGDKVVVAFAHHVDPHVDANETLDAAARYLASQGVDIVVDAYMSSVHSDAMDTCMMRPHLEHALHEAGFHGPIVKAGMAGTTEAWGRATATYVGQLTAGLPTDAKVSIHLAQHGGNPASSNPCGSGPDMYHANNGAEFQNARDAIQKAIGDRFAIRHVYGQGAAAPDDGVLSPLEALDLDAQQGIEHAIIIPYEFWGNAMDNLVPLRESLGFTPEQRPYYGPGYETRMLHKGIDVRVASAEFSTDMKAEGLLVRIGQAIEGAVQA